tara:strand:+ start:7867 stop:8388 length:522 start_codon:yes stop_codon:yes gene_type:complete
MYNLGDVSVNAACIDFIREILPAGSTILEFGSGPGSTVVLSEWYTLYSVENQKEWMSRYPVCATYINCREKMYDEEYTAPFEYQKGWYHPDDLLPNLPEKYDLILVDGPGCSRWGRGGFYKHIESFNTDVPMIFDDIHKDDKAKLVIEKVSDYVGRPWKVLEKDTDGYTGVIL